MYEYTNKQHEELKTDVKLFMKWLLVHCNLKDVGVVILEEESLHKMYEFFQDAVKTKKIPVIILSYSTVQE
ncbi:hypothetical protein ACS0TY_029651 [Phlomoides rotata]